MKALWTQEAQYSAWVEGKKAVSKKALGIRLGIGFPGEMEGLKKNLLGEMAKNLEG